MTKLLHFKSDTPRTQRILYGLCFLIGLGLSLRLAVQSPGTPFLDEVAHMVLARNTVYHPELVLNVWGRVANTIIYIIPSQFGLQGARIATVLMSIATVLMTTLVAQRFNIKHLYLIPALLMFQPWFTSLAFVATTQIPFTLVMVSGLYFWMDKRYTSATLLMGLLPLIRHEGIAITGLWFLLMLTEREWRTAILSWFPLFIYNVVYVLWLQVPITEAPSLIFLKASPTDFYGSGTWFHFVVTTIFWVGIPIFILCLFGLSPAIKKTSREQKLFLGFFAVIFITHTVIYRFGLFASGGYWFFVYPIAPAVALMAALGLEQIISTWGHLRGNRTARSLIGWLFVSILVLSVMKSVLIVQPWHNSPTETALLDAVDWLHSHDITSDSGANIVTTHPRFYEYFDLALPPETIFGTQPAPDTLAPCSIVVWDAHFSDRLGLSLEGLQNVEAWQTLAVFGDPEIQVILFRKSGADCV